MPNNNEDNTFYAINPVVGFRGWRVRKTPDGKWALFSLVMSSVMMKFIYYIGIRKKVPIDKYGYWPDKVNTAACPIGDAFKKHKVEYAEVIIGDIGFGPHESPGINCHCGIYSYNDLNLKNVHLRTSDVVGAVKLWGEILQHTKDRLSRAEHAEILALAVPNAAYRPLLVRRVKKLCKEYDIPFVNVKDLPKIALEHGEPLLEMEVDYSRNRLPKRLKRVRTIFWSLWAFNMVAYNLLSLPRDLYWVTVGPELACLGILALCFGSKKIQRLLRLDR